METILSYVEANRERFLRELNELLAIPSVSSQSERKPEMLRAAEWLKNHALGVGLQNAQILETAGHPVVYADWLGAPGKPTLLLYGHYDVQPEDPIDLWETPPFEGTVRGDNLYARGAADDKGQIFIHLKAVEAFLKNAGALPVNLKILFEGEEEVGSAHLPAFVEQHKELLKADLILISDSGMFAKGVPSVTYALRGLAYMEVEVTSAKGDLHSGSYGGSIHNPIQALAEMIASLHDKNGRITVKGMYDDVRPLTRAERAAFTKLPWSDRKYAKGLGVRQLHGEKGFSTLERLWARPTLECNGIWGGYTGEGSKTVLPSKAAAKISMRLVPDQDPDEIAELFRAHVMRVAPPQVQVNVRSLHGGKPAMVDRNRPEMQAAAAALERVFGRRPVFTREGGSIPVVTTFKNVLGVSTVLMGLGLPDDNLHSPNEKMYLPNFYRGIQVSIHFMDELAH